MRAKKIISALLSGVMLMTAFTAVLSIDGVSSQSVAFAAGETDGYIKDEYKLFEMAQYHTTDHDFSKLAENEYWEIKGDKSLDNATNHYFGLNGDCKMGYGYAYNGNWAAITFKMSVNGGGDNVIYDIDGKNIIGYCYAKGTDGLWVGHGERSYGGNVKDTYGVNRFPNYLKTELGEGTDKNNTGHTTFEETNPCVIIIENENGTVGDYSGDYYTVKTYVNDKLLSTEYYSGHFNGIGGIKNTAMQYFGDLKIYGEETFNPDRFLEIFNRDRLVMDTQYTKNGANVINAASGDAVTAKTTVTNNYSKFARTYTYTITAYSEAGEKIGDAIEGERKTVKYGESAELAAAFTVADGASYYNAVVTDISNEGSEASADAGYLTIGEELTPQMIYGTYDLADGRIIVDKNTQISDASVTLDGKTYTAAIEAEKIVLKDGETVYATKANAAADIGKLNIDITINANPVVLEKSEGGNPITGIDKDGNRMYCGDPAAVVVGDTVYLVVGHDVPGKRGYNMPDWQYFTTKDMKIWTHGGWFMSPNQVPWYSDAYSAWASQMITHKDTDGKTRYYFYYCTPDRNNNRTNRHSVGVAYSDYPNGMDENGNNAWQHPEKPLITEHMTGVSNIDPTVWVDKDENGIEHRYLMWGNTDCFICELDEDMISVKDINGDGQITVAAQFDANGLPTDGDIKRITFDNLPDDPMAQEHRNGKLVYTEAPWLYRRQSADSTLDEPKYEGKYYCFAAWGWGEKLGYATADTPWGPWTYENTIMESNLTSNTEHPSVIDFNGKTYLISHNGSLPGGNGGKRSVTVWEMDFNEDGSVDIMEELSTGLWGKSSSITARDGKYLGHDHVDGQLIGGEVIRDEGTVTLDIKAYDEKSGTDHDWEIVAGYSVTKNESADNYVSIQAVNKPGYYITSEDSGVTKLTHDRNADKGENMTYKTVAALDGKDGVSFESVKYPGQYLAVVDGEMITAKPYDFEACSFNVETNKSGEPDDKQKASVENVKEESGKITFTLKNMENEKKVTAYIAEYDANNTLAGVNMKEIVVNSSSENAEIDYARKSPDNTLKLFVWKDMKPIVDAIEVKASAKPVEVPNNMLFGMNFDNQDMGTIIGKATANGNITYAANGDGYAASLDGASYIKLTAQDGTPLLKGKDSIIVTFKAKTESKNGNGWYFYTAPNANEQANRNRFYVGIYDDYKNINAERFYNNRGTPVASAPSKVNEWQEITLVINEKKQDLYIDGQYKSTAEYTFKIADMLGRDNDDIVTYIGKACWGADGEFLKGLVDDIEVYDLAVNTDITGTSAVKNNMTLPIADKTTNGFDLTWSSSNTAVIENNGTVHRPLNGNTEVTLTATINFNGHTLTKPVAATVRGMDQYDYTLSVSNEKGVDIQPNMYGLFFEDLNFAGDGGLYAEMIENRSFEHRSTYDDYGKANHTYFTPFSEWETIEGDKLNINEHEDPVQAAIGTKNPLHPNNPTYLKFNGKSFQNNAYEGMNIENGKQYRVSFFARKNGYTGDFTVKAKTDDGTIGFSDVITDENIVSPDTTFADTNYSNNGWIKYEKEVTATSDARYSKFIMELDETAQVDFDVISVMPCDAVVNDKYGNGIFRADLVEMLKSMNPGFMRFPGGCIIEGMDMANAYRWKTTVGPVEQRKQIWNRWATHQLPENYNQTFGLGYYEYFLLCEYLECDPLPVQNVGMACEYNSNQWVPIYKQDENGADTEEYTEEFWEYVQDTLDLIDFANSTDFDNNEWARLRRDMGHEAPFNLTMIGVGNEQWERNGNRWTERYKIFEEEIHKKDPAMKIVGAAGPAPNYFGGAYGWANDEVNKGNTDFAYVLDEHFYMEPQWFLDNDHIYDDYRTKYPVTDTIKVFAGEYAAHTTITDEVGKKNNVESAIAEAAFMTGMERNADIVYMSSFAPLFARWNFTQWKPDMIWFNDNQVFGSPSYYVQKMYMQNNGSYTLKDTVTDNYDKIYKTVSYDETSGDIIIKLVNPYEYTQKIKITIDNSYTLNNADVILLSGEGKTKADINTFENPENIASETEQLTVSGSVLDYEVPELSFAVIRVHTAK